ncbi:hypothetical protein [Francisella sp. XLW-1]|uniref:hypothetical protein n=1 Tax=Francisella sp. XLW-1 TaxID=2610887 RepID=UPI00123E0617|nr:hypothetical protein [Francisella sp. XLW-1]
MGATIELSEKVTEFIENISNIDPEQFNGYKPKFAALEIGYFDYNKEIKIRPNMYDFLKSLV